MLFAPRNIAKGRHCIFDEAGRHYIDDAYRLLGESEGWLIRTTYCTDYNGRLVWIYEYAEPP